MSEVIRIFVEKKDGFNVLAKQTLWDIRHNLGMKSVEDLRYIVRYDLEGLTKEEYDKAKTIVLSEPNADVIYEETLPVEDGWKVFAMEYLPGRKIRYIGISNMTIPKLEAVLPLMKIKPAACELELHPCFQQQEQYDYLVAHNIQPVGYMPLGSPRRPERDICPEDVADMQTPEMQEIAKAHGVHPALIALKWAHQRGEISIPFSVHNYVSNLKCVTEDPLTEEEMAKIATLEKGNRLVKGQVFLWEGAKDWHDLWDEEGFIVK